ncbi:type II toxin-antitoxin system Phd/YefM family antitoxin [Hippea sp. KM1]|uniref:type II toxin-antitoxin system Phd/YefM family antitoxin n=1 Tax=Hippea sp. KM1 TaxID=944481 RepID=UPI00046D531A|nr:type II toxin-antitoxin system Phd/YefM family antitoxin [Hippea sp. KM1]
MLVDTDRIVGIAELQKNLPRIIRQLEKEEKPVFVSRRNNISAVILSAEEYKKISELLNLLEDMEIADQIRERMKNYNPEKNVSWEKVKEKYGL